MTLPWPPPQYADYMGFIFVKILLVKGDSRCEGALCYRVRTQGGPASEVVSALKVSFQSIVQAVEKEEALPFAAAPHRTPGEVLPQETSLTLKSSRAPRP